MEQRRGNAALEVRGIPAVRSAIWSTRSTLVVVLQTPGAPITDAGVSVYTGCVGTSVGVGVRVGSAVSVPGISLGSAVAVPAGVGDAVSVGGGVFVGNSSGVSV